MYIYVSNVYTVYIRGIYYIYNILVFVVYGGLAGQSLTNVPLYMYAIMDLFRPNVLVSLHVRIISITYEAPQYLYPNLI